MRILMILVCHTAKCFLLSFDALGKSYVLHKTNHVISYNDIRKQNPTWSRMVSEHKLHFPYFRKGVTTHGTIDNGRSQETPSGSCTTHGTIKSIFHDLSTEERKFTNDWRTRETTSRGYFRNCGQRPAEI